MKGRTRTSGSQSGFSLLEMMVAIAVIGIVTAIAVVQTGIVRSGFRSDGAMRRVMAELNTARELAIAQRRLVEVSFLGTNRLVVTRIEVPTGATVLQDVIFEGGAVYSLVAGVADTPDAFGNSAAISFGSAPRVMFNTEGMLVTSAGTPINGTVFLALPNEPLSFRAVTVLGSTGRVRGYRWNGGQWTRV